MTTKPKKKKTPPQTVKFEKEIVTEGAYRQFNPKTGKYEIRHVSKEELTDAVSTFNQMKTAGLRVPAPWKHDFNITSFPIEEGQNGLLEDSSKNAGFWDSLMTRVTDEGKVALVGVIEASPENADKIGTDVKDTSIYMRKKFVDGTGKEWENVLMHIALVTHPIEPGQKNFERLEEDDSIIAMSELMLPDAQISELSTKLKSCIGLYLPPDTTRDNLVERLLISVNQYELLEEDEDGNSSNTSRYNVEPVLMSHFTKEQIDALVSSGAVNPKTKKPFTVEDFADKKEDAKPDHSAVVMSNIQSHMQAERRIALRRRIDALVESGRTVKEYADASLYPQADSYVMSFTEAGLTPSVIESVIASIEAMPAPPKKTQGDTVVMDHSDLSADDAKSIEDIANEMISFL